MGMGLLSKQTNNKQDMHSMDLNIPFNIPLLIMPLKSSSYWSLMILADQAAPKFTNIPTWSGLEFYNGKQ